MSDRVTLTITGQIADVRLARPEKINALDQAMFAAIGETIDALKSRPAIRAVVLSGEGRGFSAGLDLESFAANPALRDIRPRTHGAANIFQYVAWGWRALPMPVIAAVHGFAFGGAFQIMLGADIRIAAPDTQLSIMEMRWGLVPDMAGIALLRTLVRDDIARELTYTARKFSGTEAHQYGLVTSLAENPYDAAMRLAQTIAANSPDATRAAKRLINLAADSHLAAILQAESDEQQALMASPNQMEAVAAGLAKRAPNFIDPVTE